MRIMFLGAMVALPKQFRLPEKTEWAYVALLGATLPRSSPLFHFLYKEVGV